ncbi:hypothetical protein [Pseudolabrys sp. FHR47]|uniref:hypothetical protein n=1 Tax=Pseudolabrys sp. FHR47 TaxID=2562284 RepID=UPI0010BE4926|nr:hypothetical protein [Pseudolabrys sp. FHR47]
MPNDDTPAPEQGAQILNFSRRPGTPVPPRPTGDRTTDVVEDLTKYTRDETSDDYRHRMAVNAVAFAFVVVLGLVGYWLADTMATMRKNQDCVLTGRRDCTPVEVPTRERF